MLSSPQLRISVTIVSSPSSPLATRRQQRRQREPSTPSSAVAAAEVEEGRSSTTAPPRMEDFRAERRDFWPSAGALRKPSHRWCRDGRRERTVRRGSPAGPRGPSGRGRWCRRGRRGRQCGCRRPRSRIGENALAWATDMIQRTEACMHLLPVAGLTTHHAGGRSRSNAGGRRGHQQQLGEADVAERASNAVELHGGACELHRRGDAYGGWLGDGSEEEDAAGGGWTWYRKERGRRR